MDAVNTNDETLIAECLDGRAEAFGQLVVRHQDRLYHSLVRMLGCPDDARDVAQDAFVLAFQKLSTFRGQSRFYSWLFRIAMNVAISERRRPRHRVRSLDAIHEQAGVQPTDSHPSSAPSHSVELAEQQELVQKALARLSDEFRTVLVLKEMEDLKYEEIAEIMECPVGTVRSRIHRARQELREILAAEMSKNP
ncbi:MAG: sigma-70 family RNA polymerase sigma factor [Planctomycetaceae bacterium]|nr:sigma-70 family RNA polymerase sigma factor [Planctomycetaceae bacterium]